MDIDEIADNMIAIAAKTGLQNGAVMIKSWMKPDGLVVVQVAPDSGTSEDAIGYVNWFESVALEYKILDKLLVETAQWDDKDADGLFEWANSNGETGVVMTSLDKCIIMYTNEKERFCVTPKNCVTN